MDSVLYVIGMIVIAIGILLGVGTISQLDRMGFSLNNIIALSALGTAAGTIVVGILFTAFGTVISLLKRIEANGQQAIAFSQNVAQNTYAAAKRNYD